MRTTSANHFLLCRFIVCILLSTLAVNTWAALNDSADRKSEVQALDGISDAVELFIISQIHSDQKIDVEVKSLDNRLRLQRCNSELEPSWSQGTRKLGRVTVRVACSGPKPWRVNVQATVTMQSEVWTLARSVDRGELLSADMLVLQEVTLGKNNGVLRSLGVPVTDIEPLLGFEFIQRVSAEKVLNDRMLKPAKLISKGDAVIIRHRSNGLELQTRGIALGDAAAYQQTQVRNSSSGKIVDAVAVSGGIVETLR